LVVVRRVIKLKKKVMMLVVFYCMLFVFSNVYVIPMLFPFGWISVEVYVIINIALVLMVSTVYLDELERKRDELR
jgi:uncharacterized membrane protein YhfC